MRRNSYFGASGQKSDPVIRSGALDFLQDGYISNIRWCLRHILDVLCTILFDLVTLTFDLSTLMVPDELRAWHIQQTYQFLASYGFLFMSYVRLNLITLPSPRTVTAHAPCHVTYHRGEKWSTFLKSLTPIYLFTLSLSRRYDKDLAILYAKNSVYPIVKATEFTAHAQYHVTCA